MPGWWLLPSDHMILKEEKFIKVVQDGLNFVNDVESLLDHRNTTLAS